MLLVEPAAYSIRLTRPKNRDKKKHEVANAIQVTRTVACLQHSEEKDYAHSHGRFRGARNANDALTPLSDPPFSKDDESEGAYIFVQATSCRRNVLCTVFVNPAPRSFYFPTFSIISHTLSEPIVPCCDVCDPSLLDLVRPGLRPKSTTKKLTYSKQPSLKVVSALRDWRQKVLINDKHPRYLPASYILSEEAIDKLASLSPCTESAVKGYLSQQWVFWTMYGPDVTTIVMLSQPQCENTIPSLATDHQHKDRNVGLGAVHGSGDTQYATRNYKRRRSCSPIDLLFASTEHTPQRQKRARRAVTNTPSYRNATVGSSSWSRSQSQSQSQSQSPHLPFLQPVSYRNATMESSSWSQSQSHSQSPHLPFSQPVSYHNATMESSSWSQSQSPHLSFSQPVSVMSSNDVATGHLKMDASPVPLLSLHRPQPPHSHPPMHPNALLGPLSPYQLPLSSQPLTSTPSWHTPAHSSTPLMSLGHPRHLRHSAAHNPPHFFTPISNRAVNLQLRTPMPLSHHWNSTSTPVPNASRLHPQIFGISAPHSPFHGPTVVASSSGGPHTAAYQHNITFESPTPREPVNPSRTPLSLPQYHRCVLPSGHAHPVPPHLGLFTPFPSPHPMVPPEEHHNSLNFSLH